ncbi:hypothetical protein [uncultured Ralstonia sp.]|jgi:hypothetical protein|uniref:DUF7940 domain-containing protein n=1 Tax=uncultured Ralstonia sp. TaxID=114715 RepID=UPI001EA9FC42|nr:hypothetical protein [uncultured Ralstonia sp.]UCF25474.1 MAG: hypothetical protein JSV72_08840 [Ralstonia sp.]
MKFRLIDEWRQAHTFASVRLGALFAALFGIGPTLISAWGLLPDDLKAQLPQGWGRVIATAGFVLVLAARVFTTDKGAGDVAQ